MIMLSLSSCKRCSIAYAQSAYRLPAAPVIATTAASAPAVAQTFANFLLLHRFTTIFFVVDTNPPGAFLAYAEEVRRNFRTNHELAIIARTISTVRYEASRTSYDELLNDFQNVARGTAAP